MHPFLLISISIFRFVLFSHHYRFAAVLLRDRFDQNKDIVDMRQAKKLLGEGEEELFLKQHPQPLVCE